MDNEQRAELLLRKYGFDFDKISPKEITELIQKEIENFQEGSAEYIRVLCGYLYCIGDASNVCLIKKAKYEINFYSMIQNRQSALFCFPDHSFPNFQSIHHLSYIGHQN